MTTKYSLIGGSSKIEKRGQEQQPLSTGEQRRVKPFMVNFFSGEGKRRTKDLSLQEHMLSSKCLNSIRKAGREK